MGKNRRTKRGRKEKKGRETDETKATPDFSNETTEKVQEAPKTQKRKHKELDAISEGPNSVRVATESNDEQPEAKRRRIAEIAKSRLSKFAARLFDPNRPRGLIEPPQVIPLNDEFLQEFGKRQKELDQAMGIDQPKQEPIVDEEQNNELQIDTSEPLDNDDETKVKISNLKYTITANALQAACSKFGPISHLHLVPDENNSNLNAGRAYVTFIEAQSAQACVDNLKSLENRPLTITIMPKKPSKTPGGGGGGGALKRYWAKDISTKCYRCGGVGHIAGNCPNEAMAKACPLCASTDHDNPGRCPMKVFCFNCGIPGHVAKDCTKERGLPVRRLCTICFRSGHDKYNCRVRIDPNIIREAICVECGKKGHFLCKELGWFFDLKGIFCWNCGESGHIGPHCRRPGLEACRNNDEVAARELERASAYTPTDNMTGSRDERGRSNARTQTMNRAKSMPPERSRSSMNRPPR